MTTRLKSTQLISLIKLSKSWNLLKADLKSKYAIKNRNDAIFMRKVPTLSNINLTQADWLIFEGNIGRDKNVAWI